MAYGSSTKTTNRTHPLAYLALAGLLLFQVGYAAHQSEHAIGELSETCQLCVQLDQSDQAIATTAAPTVPAAAQAVPDTGIPGSAPAFPSIVYRSRAPPLP